MNYITANAARKLYDRVQGNTPIAVFANGCGSWHAVKYQSKTFDTMLQRNPDHFVGVFDFNVTLAQLQDELEAAGIK